MYVQQEKHRNENLFSEDYTKTLTIENCDKSLTDIDRTQTR